VQPYPVVNVKQKIYECIRVVYPAEVEDDSSVKIGQPKRTGLDDGRKEDGKRGD